MPPYQRAFGLKTFWVCWLLVLLVPAWRIDAQRKWHEEHLNYSNPVGNLDATVLGQMARRFPDDPAVQLEQIFASRPQRPIPVAVQNDGTTHLAPVLNADAIMEGYKKDNVRKVMYLERYRLLSQRFPQDKAIRYAWLRDMNLAPLITVPQVPLATGPHSPDSVTIVAPPLPLASRSAALKCAQEGERAEPKNAFFPWMEAALSFSMHRDAVALNSIERAGRCTYFDDGVLDTVKRRIELLGRVQHVGWAERSYEAWSILLPHLSLFRSTARTAMERADIAHAQGRNRRAVQIAASLQRAGSVICRGRQLFITVLIGEAIQYIAWNSTLKSIGQGIDAPKQGIEDVEAHAEARGLYASRLAAGFASYAREVGETDIANAALAALPKFHTQSWDYALSFQEVEGSHGRIFGQFFWLGGQLLRLTLASALVWLATWLLTCRMAVRAFPGRRAVVSWAGFCLGATVALFMFGIQGLGVGAIELGWDDENRTSALGLSFEKYLHPILLLLWLVPVVWLTLRSLMRPATKAASTNISSREQGINWARIGWALLYVCFLLALGSVLLAIGKPVESFWGQIFSLSLAAFGMSAVLGSVLHIVFSKGRRRIAVLFMAGAFWLRVGALFAAGGLDGNFYGPLIGIVDGLLLLAGLFFADFDFNALIAHTLPEITMRMRILAAILAVAGSVFYVGLNLVQFPFEKAAIATLDRQLKIGEVAWLDEQLAQK